METMAIAHDRWRRQRLLPWLDDAAQERIESASVLVTRVGGLGGPLVQSLAMAGVGRIVFFHEGILGEEDLNRMVLDGPGAVARSACATSRGGAPAPRATRLRSGELRAARESAGCGPLDAHVRSGDRRRSYVRGAPRVERRRRRRRKTIRGRRNVRGRGARDRGCAGPIGVPSMPRAGHPSVARRLPRSRRRLCGGRKHGGVVCGSNPGRCGRPLGRAIHIDFSGPVLTRTHVPRRTDCLACAHLSEEGRACFDRSPSE